MSKLEKYAETLTKSEEHVQSLEDRTFSKDKTLLEGVLTALVLDRTESKQCSSYYVNESEKLAAESASLEVAFLKQCDDSYCRVSRLQTTLQNDTNQAEEDAKKRSRFFVVEKSVKEQLRNKEDDSKKLEGF